LSHPSRDHIPYRQSKLTYFLKDSLGGNCKTLMVANIWGESSHLDETVSTLKFASRMMRVSNTAIVNVHMNPEAQLKRYEKQIKELKQELSMHDQLRGVSQANYEPYTDDQRYELSKVVRKYVDDQIDNLEVSILLYSLFYINTNIFRLRMLDKYMKCSQCLNPW
jgi:kinesin family protein 6/9